MKELFKIYYYSFLFILFPLLLHGQYISMGQDPANIKWDQINTLHFQVIFPKGTEIQAQRVAAILDYAYTYDTYTLKHNPKKVSVILHNYSAVSNAFAVYAPRRIEYLMCPPQDIYSQEWAEQLAIHEFRHIIQMDKMNQGLTKLLYIVFGQQVSAIVLGLFVPSWFLEGDAVCTETALSYAGRGRSPLFEAKLRAQLLQQGTYSFEKESFGSYRDYVPNDYEFGYFMVGHTRAKYGVQVWDTALNITAKYPILITPFNRGIKKTTGKSKVKLYEEVMHDLTETWKSQDETITPTYHEVIMASDNNYINYECVRYAEDNKFIALKTSIDDIDRIVRFERKGHEEIIFTPGFMPDKQISYTKQTVCWVENKPNPRWEHKSSTVIKIFNIKTNKINKIDNKTRYFAPDISPNGKYIAVVEVSYENINSLVLLEATSGKVINKVQIENNLFIATPRWGNDTTSVVCTVLGPLGKSIAHINIFAGIYDLIIPFTPTDISNPVQYGKYIYFTAAYSGMSDVCAIEYGSTVIKQVIVSRFGANKADISDDGGAIIYTDYSGLGAQISEATINNDFWNTINESKENVYNLGDILAEKEKGLVVSEDIPTDLYTVKKYAKWKHLINIHSWGPAFIDVSTQKPYAGASIMSQNVLSTSFLTLGYLAKTKQYYLNYKYKGWYPVLDFTLQKGWQEDSFITDDSIQETINYRWIETQYLQTLSLPLNFTRNKYYRLIEPSIQHTFVTKEMDLNSRVRFKRNAYELLTYRLRVFNLLKRSLRDLESKWGQLLDIGYTHDPIYGLNAGTIASGELSLYFPGLLNHHSLCVYTGLQKKVISDYVFTDKIIYPRGYYYPHHNEALSILTTYKLPLFYPDAHIGSIMYIKRIKSALFYDYAIVKDASIENQLQSGGFDLTCDLHLFRFYSPLEIGIRTVFIQNQHVQYQVLFNYSL